MASFGGKDETDEGSQQYPYPSHVNVANFVYVKLSGNHNYGKWKEQMVCLLDSHDMIGFIDGTFKKPQEDDGSKAKADMDAFKVMYRRWERSDKLVKGWIYGSLCENMMSDVYSCLTAQELWIQLKAYGPPKLRSSKPQDLNMCLVLYRAIELGDWEKAQEIFNQDKCLLTDAITVTGENALKIAISNHPNTYFLQNLLNEIEVNEESLPTLGMGLCFAIKCGNKAAVEMLVDKTPRVLFIEDHSPLEMAAGYNQRTILDYLFQVCRQYIDLAHMFGYTSPFKGEKVSMLLESIIGAEYFDVAYDLLKECYHELATCDDVSPWGIACHLAEKPDAFRSGKQYNFYQRFVYSHIPVENCSLGDIQMENQERRNANLVAWKSYVYPVMEKIYVKFWEFALLHVPHIKGLHEDKVKHNKVLTFLKFCCKKNSKLIRTHEGYRAALLTAVKNDIPEVVKHITRSFPQSIRMTKDGAYTIYEISIMHRCEKAYNVLVHEEEPYHKNLHHQSSIENLLQLAGNLAPEHKLDMEVSKLMAPNERKSHNREKETPMMVFRKQHKDLKQKGEDRMKQVANAYSITAGLIITIAFAAVINVLKGNNEEIEKANYYKRLSYSIYIVSDAITIFTSTTSLLLFLSILKARYTDEDFLYKLPKRLILGLVMLFMVVTTMLVAFSAMLYIMFGHENLWIWVPIAAMALLPITSFVTLQLPLLVDLISSTYGHGIFGNRSELWKTL